MLMEVKRVFACDFCEKSEADAEVIIVGLRDCAICNSCALVAAEAAQEAIDRRMECRSDQYNEFGPLLPIPRQEIVVERIADSIRRGARRPDARFHL